MLVQLPEARPNLPPWRVLCVRPQREKYVAEALNKKGYEQFQPTFQQHRRWHDRKVTLDVPLFAGYVFCRFEFEERAEILRTLFVHTILSHPATEQEIDSIKTILASGLTAGQAVPLQLGQKVEIVCGPLVGQVGVLKKFKGQWQLLVAIEGMGRSLRAVIEREWARPLKAAA